MKRVISAGTSANGTRGSVRAVVEWAGHYLVRIFIGGTDADLGDITSAAHQHGLLGEQLCLGELLSLAAVEISHEPGHVRLRGAGAARVGGKAELACDRELQAGAIEQFASIAAFGRVLRHYPDKQLLPHVAVKMASAASHHAGAFE